MMLLSNRKLFFLLIALFALTCDQGVEPPYSSTPHLTTANLKDIKLNLLSYDKVAITHQLGSNLVSKEVLAIGIGRRDSSGYVESLYSPAKYDFEFYVHKFDFSSELGYAEFLPHLVIRYYLLDSSFSDIDTIVAAYEYPYPETEIVATTSILIDNARYFQDIDRMGNTLFFHPMAAYGLFKYDLVTRTTTRLLNYGSGEVIAADSIFVFCHVRWEVHRFNLLTNTVDLVFPQYFGDIKGLDTYNQHLYLLKAGYPNLFKFTYDGVLVDSLYVPGLMLPAQLYMTIHDGVIFFHDWHLPEITRFDLATMTYLPNVLAPYLSSDGIKIYDDHLYFCDARGFIGCVPLTSLRSP